MSHVYISHSAKDFDALLELHEALRAAAIPDWYVPNDGASRDMANQSIDDAFAMIVLVSASSVRSKAVRQDVERAKARAATVPAAPEVEPAPGGDDAAFRRRCRMRWAALIKRVFQTDPLRCPQCKGQMKIISFIQAHQQQLIEQIVLQPNDDLVAPGGLGQVLVPGGQLSVDRLECRISWPTNSEPQSSHVHSSLARHSA